VYHEFLRKFSELLTISPDGKLVSKKRLTPALGLIQPSVVPLTEKSFRVFYRQNGNRFRTVMTNRIPDISAPGLESIEATSVPNPDSAVSVVRRSNGEFLMVCNPLETGRHKLSLATSSDGISWKIVRDIEESQTESEFSYPYLIRGIEGEYHLIYTWNRTKMRFASFTEQWLESTP
jgi:predicted neuraminidase